MKTIILGATVFFLIILTGCSNFISPRSNVSEVCLQQCHNHFSACYKTCDNSCIPCQKEAMRDAAKRYYNYTREIAVSSSANIRQLKSERDPLQCRKVSCNCYADLLACRQACGGRINKTLRVAPVCT